MRRAFLLAVGVFFVSLAAANAGETTEAAWFDMDNCVFCKHLKDDPGLLKNMTWKHYDITNGVLAVTTINPEYKDSYVKAQKAMMEVGAKMGTGEIDPMSVTMCGHCQTYGMLMEMGVTFDHVPTETADILIMTSDKPEVVEKIKKYAARSEAELAKTDE